MLKEVDIAQDLLDSWSVKRILTFGAAKRTDDIGYLLYLLTIYLLMDLLLSKSLPFDLKV